MCGSYVNMNMRGKREMNMWEKGKCIRREMSTDTGDDPGPYRSVHALYVYPMCGSYVIQNMRGKREMNTWEKGKCIRREISTGTGDRDMRAPAAGTRRRVAI